MAGVLARCGRMNDRVAKSVCVELPAAQVRWWAPGRHAWVLALCGLALLARADDGWERQILTLNLENDLTVNRDRHYTAGARLAYLSADDSGPGWFRDAARGLPAWGFENTAQKWGLEIGQEIYTPDHLHEPDVQPDDRPYAGWLYGGLALQRRGPGPGPARVMETIRLDVGVVGPEALGEQAQDWVHARDPQGWSNQLETEVAFAFRYQRRYRLAWRSREQTWGMDFIPQGDASLGTLNISLGLSGLVRLGYQIPDEFATGTRPPRFGVYIFTGVEGRAVLHNLFLDGNTFADSHGVAKEPWVGSATAGGTLVLRPIEATLAHTFLTPEFKTQQGTDSFTSFFLTVKF